MNRASKLHEKIVEITSNISNEEERILVKDLLMDFGASQMVEVLDLQNRIVELEKIKQDSMKFNVKELRIQEELRDKVIDLQIENAKLREDLNQYKEKVIKLQSNKI